MTEIHIDKLLEVCSEVLGSNVELRKDGKDTMAISTDKSDVIAVIPNKHGGKRHLISIGVAYKVLRSAAHGDAELYNKAKRLLRKR